MQVGSRDIEVESRNDFVPIQDSILTKVTGVEILLDSFEVLRSDFAMVVALELGVLLGSWVWILDRVFDLLTRDFKRFCDGYSGPFEVVILTALDVSQHLVLARGVQWLSRREFSLCVCRCFGHNCNGLAVS